MLIFLFGCPVFAQLNPTYKTVTATKSLISDTSKAITMYQKFASKTVNLETFDFKKTGVFRNWVVFQDTVTLGNVVDIYLTRAEVHKNLYLYNPLTDLASPSLIFKQPNSLTTGTDSVSISMVNSPLGVKALNMSHPIQFTEFSSSGLTGLARLLTMNGDTIITKGQTNKISRIYPVDATSGQVLKWTGSVWAPGTDVTGGGGGGAAFIRIRNESGSFSNYPDSSIRVDSNFALSANEPYEVTIRPIQPITTLSSPTFVNGIYTGTLISGAHRATGLSVFDSLQITGSPAAVGTAPLYVDNNSGSANGSIAIFKGQGTKWFDVRANGRVRIGDPTSLDSQLTVKLGGHVERGFLVDGATTLTGIVSTGNLTSTGSVTAQSFGLHNLSFSGTTNFTQTSIGTMTISNTGGIYLNTPLIGFQNGSFIQTDVQDVLTGNRTIHRPDNSGVYAVGAISPLFLSSTGILSVTGGLITSLSGLTASVQTFSVGSSGTTPNIVSSVANHQFNFPLAAAGVTSGTINNVAQTITGPKTMSSPFTTKARNLAPLVYTDPVLTVAILDTSAEFIVLDPSVQAVNQTVLLPSVSGRAGRTYIFSRYEGSATSLTLTIVPNGLEKIDGKTSIVLTDNFDYVRLITDGNVGIGWRIVGAQLDGASYSVTDSLKLTAAVAYISAASDSVFFSIPGFDSTKGWVGGATYTDARMSQLPLPTPQLIKRPGGISIRANYDWTIDNVEISFLYKLKK